MKKILIISIALLTFCIEVNAQQNDTLSCGRQRNYAYTSGWYDTCAWYLDPKGSTQWWQMHPNPHFYESSPSPGEGDRWYIAYRQHTSDSLSVRGIWAMEWDSPLLPDPGNEVPRTIPGITNHTKLPEYVYLYVLDSSVAIDSIWPSRFLKRIATARWDTLQPKTMCIQRFADGSPNPHGGGPFVYCNVYEIPFDTIHTLQGEFWIAGSISNNYLRLSGHSYDHIPTFYLEWADNYTDRNFVNARTAQNNGPDGPWHGRNSWAVTQRFGPFGVITDYQWLVEVSSADTLRGNALYTAFYPDSSTQTITAVPRRGFKFSHWNDGNTDNPRTILVTQDSSFTAYFEPRDLYYVSLTTNYPFCLTTGDSIYYEGDSATIYAYSTDDNYRFSHWNDSVTDNPRTLLVTQDTDFTAYFQILQDTLGIGSAPSDGLFTLTPNPTDGQVTLTLARPLGDESRLTLRDAAGHELLVRTLAPRSRSFTLSLRHLPSGPYFLTLTSPGATATQKIILR